MVDDFEFKTSVEDSEEDKNLSNLVKDKVSQEELIIEAQNFFNTQKKDLSIYAKKGEQVIKVNFEELSEQSPDLAERVVFKPEETLKILEIALHETDLISNPKIHITNLSATQNIIIGNVRSKHFNQLVSLKGKIIKISKVYPKCILGRFECPSCGSIIQVLQIDEKFREPLRCTCGRRSNFRELEKEISDFFEITLFDEKSGGQMSFEFDGPFLNNNYKEVFEVGNFICVTGFFLFTGKERTEKYQFFPSGAELIKQKQQESNLEEYIETLRRKEREGATEFEVFVGEIFKRKGYSVTVTKPSGDFGIDVVAEKDTEKIAIQCKLFPKENKIGAQSVQSVLGSSVSPYDATKVIFITTAGGYTRQALEQMKTSKIPIELWNRERLFLESEAHINNLDEAWSRLNKIEEEKMGYATLKKTKSDNFEITPQVFSNKSLSKISQVRQVVEELENKLGKLVPVQEVIEKLQEKMTREEIEESIDKLIRAGELFRPKAGCLMRI